jgi:hypothetical protein
MRSPIKRTLIVVCSVALLAAGGVASAVALGANGHGKKAHANKSLKTTSGTTGTTATPLSNEDATHEAGESATREADETAGRVGHGRGGAHTPNEAATHEAGESAAREAQEDAAKTTTTP